MKRSHAVILIIALVLLIDQVLKVYIKTHFHANEHINLFGENHDWAQLRFVENEGMAFGITFDWAYGKLLLSTFRILMVAGLIWYIRMLLQANVTAGFVYSVALITAGALGNIIDSAFYGLIFTESPYHEGVAQLVAPGQGYGTFLHGKVVDMLYFPMTWIHIPEWIPYFGGEDYLFFSAIFNIADSAITCGVLSILLFQRHFFKEPQPQQPDEPASEEVLTADDEPAERSSDVAGVAEHESTDVPAPEASASRLSDDEEQPLNKL